MAIKLHQVRLIPAIHQTLRWLSPVYPGRRRNLAALAFFLIIGLIGLPATSLLLLIGLGLLIYGAYWLYSALHFIDAHIAATTGALPNWPVHNKVYPLYKFVDIYRAAQTFASRQPDSAELRTAHTFTLSTILHGLSRHMERHMNTADLVSRKIGYQQESYLPIDTFWLLPPSIGASASAGVIRVTLAARGTKILLEVAAPRAEDATRMLDTIAELASAQSIYRNHTIRVVFGSEVQANYGDEETPASMDLIFYKETPITEADIILDETHQAIIERTIVDFHQRRAELQQLGLPGKRGVLFYGPPGTGKTYTCKYIASRLESATTLVVTGHALLHMKAICAIAKMLQPTLVLLEDVDLVFAHRENNAYNTVLGEFIDQLDGFGDTDQLIFILTTNAIERIESAIKDRPGRVSQCIYFGPPSATLRQRYLTALIQPYDTSSANLPQLVGQTEGVSQAFLKELVFRTVQIASGQASYTGSALRLTDEHFDTALREMTSGSGRVAQRIIGFRMDTERHLEAKGNNSSG
jgi:cell division protease FtsH